MTSATVTLAGGIWAIAGSKENIATTTVAEHATKNRNPRGCMSEVQNEEGEPRLRGGANSEFAGPGVYRRPQT
ncbi:hypothetical protein LBMAG52_19500 [Planctomycetia bacterium]|nr:hypothetical protein LBMAG52_19500 [Planctomycetia bacterium]